MLEISFYSPFHVLRYVSCLFLCKRCEESQYQLTLAAKRMQVLFLKEHIDSQPLKLPYGLSEEEFLAGISKPVNPDLMDIFKSCRIIERSGHGVPEVVKVYGKNAYKFSANTITVTIPFDKTGFNQDGKINGKINSDELSKVETSVLNAIMENNRLTIPLICAQTGLSQRSMSRALDLLRNKGKIERIGPRKTGHWEIVEKDEED